MNSEKDGYDGEPQLLPPEITRQYSNKCLIYSEAEKRVIGVGDTWKEAFDQADASGAGRPWHCAFAFAPDESIV